MANLVEPAPPGSLTEIPSKAEKENSEALSGSSAKIDQLLKLLQQPKLARLWEYSKEVQSRPSFVATFDKVRVL